MLSQLGKMDLTEVEGTADLLAADTAAQQRQARTSDMVVLGVQHSVWKRALVSQAHQLDMPRCYSPLSMPPTRVF